MSFIKSISLLIVIIFIHTTGFAQEETEKFHQIYYAMQQKDFFDAKDMYSSEKQSLSPAHQIFTEALLNNAFNRLEESNKNIQVLVQNHLSELPDSLQLDLYEIKKDNSIKLHEYEEARNAINLILDNYQDLFSEEEINDYKNDFKIWSALADQPKQEVVIEGASKLKIQKDKAGLDNLKVTANGDTFDFIFDTGANLSTVTKSTADELNMEIIPAKVEVGTVTGTTVPAQLGVCDMMTLGNITIYNAVFLVLEDEALSFPEIGYQIYGILGFPVMEALKEIQITKEGYFVVPKEETDFERSNMAMDKLQPLILIGDDHFTFDTGADRTILYAPYFADHRKKIVSDYTETSIRFGGAGGNKEYTGYNIDLSANLFGKDVTLKDVALLKEQTGMRDEYIYGNIGQDLINQFDKMTINFNQMFIKFSDL